MKRAFVKRRRRLPEVDVGQIIESLKLTPTQRLEKHRAFIAMVEEIERAARLRESHR